MSPPDRIQIHILTYEGAPRQLGVAHDCALAAIDEPRVRGVLARLYAEEKKQVRAMVPLAWQELRDKVLGRTLSVEEEVDRIKNLYVSLSPKQGRLANMVARSIGAGTIVEFGTSFAISTIHLAAALRDNGGGRILGTEMVPAKAAQARANLEAAGLSEYAEIREGDARQTLRETPAPIDLVLLDGAKGLYLEMLELLAPRLRRGSVVLADNIFLFRRALAPYVAHVQDSRNGYSSVTLFLGSGTEYSIRL
jgi:predicted O-methyltransferase YrrM